MSNPQCPIQAIARSVSYNPRKHILLTVSNAAINRKCIPLLPAIKKNPKTFS
ncbi:hypothetical protein [Nostoc sp.]|uniref:hypothetical protein n=1 Tax=Nostoc sp. TaxID=1180 RepID=UPI002FFCAB8B